MPLLAHFHRRAEEDKVADWPMTVTMGEDRPGLPLWLLGVDGPIRVDLEAAYTLARQRSAIG